MSKQRYVNTKFWTDGYISELDPIEKLLFLYFITNQQTDICGIYEVPLKTVSTDTGIEKEMVKKVLDRFERDEKMKYQNGWICIRNFIKHQSENPKIKRGIEISLEKVPQWCIAYTYSIDRQSHSNTKSNSNSNTNYDLDSLATDEPLQSNPVTKLENQQIVDIIKAFETVDVKNKKFYGNKTQRQACKFLIDNYGFDETIQVISKLPASNKISFYKVYTPNDLVDKWQKVKDDIEMKVTKEKSKPRQIIF